MGYLNGRLVGEASTSFCAPTPPTQEKRGHATARAQGQGDWEREARQQADGSPAAACLRAVYKSVFTRILNPLAPEVHAPATSHIEQQQREHHEESLSLTGIRVSELSQGVGCRV